MFLSNLGGNDGSQASKTAWVKRLSTAVTTGKSLTTLFSVITIFVIYLQVFAQFLGPSTTATTSKSLSNLFLVITIFMHVSIIIIITYKYLYNFYMLEKR